MYRFGRYFNSGRLKTSMRGYARCLTIVLSLHNQSLNPKVVPSPDHLILGAKIGPPDLRFRLLGFRLLGSQTIFGSQFWSGKINSCPEPNFSWQHNRLIKNFILRNIIRRRWNGLVLNRIMHWFIIYTRRAFSIRAKRVHLQGFMWLCIADNSL